LLAARLLFGFGIAYTLYGLRHAWLKRNESSNTSERQLSWILFIIFALGPCEPLIPLLMTPAAAFSAQTLAAVSSVFLVCTVCTMLAVVTLALKGTSFLPNWRLGNFSHAFAGAAIVMCASAMLFLGM
jgi:nickel/cobalt transporter (NicO) family protein